jgi:hypothetical protein
MTTKSYAIIYYTLNTVRTAKIIKRRPGTFRNRMHLSLHFNTLPFFERLPVKHLVVPRQRAPRFCCYYPITQTIVLVSLFSRSKMQPKISYETRASELKQAVELLFPNVMVLTNHSSPLSYKGTSGKRRPPRFSP